MAQTKFTPTEQKLIPLNIGESLILQKKDWPSIYSPSAFLQRVMKRQKTKYTYKQINENTAWEITRIK